MKVLLDTHVFLWWVMDEPSLSMRAREVISNSRNEVFFSAASGWEIAIKASRGRLELPTRPHEFVATQLSLNAFQTLPIQLSHALQVYNLPDLHRDPFDRLLIAQCQVEKLAFICGDAKLAEYGVEIIF